MLGANPDGTLAGLLDDCADAAVDALAPEPVWTRVDFATVAATRSRIGSSRTRSRWWPTSNGCSPRHTMSGSRCPTDRRLRRLAAIADIRGPDPPAAAAGFVTSHRRARTCATSRRYVTAIGRRLDRLPRDVDIDLGRMTRVQTVQHAYDEVVHALPTGRAAADDVRDIGRLIEELRVSLWAQQLGTARPVSEQRIYRAIDAIAP